MTLKHRKMKFKPSIKLNHNIYSYSRIVAPFPILFPRGQGGCTQSISCASYSVSCNPVLTPYLSWGYFNFIWTSQCQRAHVTLYLCFWFSFERYIARAFSCFYTTEEEGAPSKCLVFSHLFNTYFDEIVIYSLSCVAQVFSNFEWTPRNAS